MHPATNNENTGTGTGIWAIDFADAYPSASVIATDLTPIQPQMVPPNLEFQIDDFTQPWTFPPNHFDFIPTSINDVTSSRTLRRMRPMQLFCRILILRNRY